MYGKLININTYHEIPIPVTSHAPQVILYEKIIFPWYSDLYQLVLLFLTIVELIVSIALTVLVFKNNKNKYLDIIASINWIKDIVLFFLIMHSKMDDNFIFRVRGEVEKIYQSLGIGLLVLLIVLFIVQIIFVLIYINKKKGEPV